MKTPVMLLMKKYPMTEAGGGPGVAAATGHCRVFLSAFSPPSPSFLTTVTTYAPLLHCATDGAAEGSDRA